MHTHVCIYKQCDQSILEYEFMAIKHICKTIEQNF